MNVIKNTRGLASVLLVAAWALHGSGCIFLSEGETTQCSSDADCGAFGENSVCEESVCVSRATGAGGSTPTTTTSDTSSTGGGGGDGGCVSNKQCADDNGQLPYMCRQPGEECVSLLSEDCLQVFGDFTDENAIVFGMMAPLTQFDFVAADYFITTELATGEFEQFLAGGGLPGGATGESRPIVMVLCDELEDPQRAARHLVDEIQVPAISGPGYSEKLLEVATEITIPAGVLLLTPSATSPLIANLPDDGLVMSSIPNSVTLVDGLIPVVQDVEEKVRLEQAIPPEDDIKLALTVAGDAFDLSLGNPISTRLIVNGRSTADNQGTFRRFDYGDPLTEAVDYSSLVASLIDYEPHVLVMVGQIEMYEEVMELVESNWPGTAPKPNYVFLDKLIPTLIDYLEELDPLEAEDVRSRLRGVRFSTDLTSPNYTSFRIRYEAIAPDDAVIGPYNHNIYDTLYMLAYSTMTLGSIAPRNITGAALATGILRLNPPGTPIDVGPDQLQQGVNLLTADPEGMDYVGTEGPVDIDAVTGSPVGNSEVWCVNEANQYAFGGQSYNAESNELEGEFACEPPEG